MAKTTVEINLKTAFALTFILIGLGMLAYVSFTAYQLATGIKEPLTVSESPIGYGNEILYGILLQIGMFALLIAVAFILMKFGFMLILKR